MARTREQISDVLGSQALTHFDFCVIGSGAGGATAAHVLAAAGKNVLVLEAGHNPFPGLDQPGAIPPPLHSNDELKYEVRGYLDPPGLLMPRTFRTDANQAARILGDVNALPQALGGAFQHADMKAPRFNVVDFELRSHIESLIGRTPGLQVPGFGSDAASANFADWPFSYADLEPFYVEAEALYGVAGTDDDPFASWRSAPYPMPPGNPMYHSLLLAEGARNTPFEGGFLHPHTYPTAINSRPYDGRPACNDCGPCSGFGCPSHAKSSPAVTALRKALLTECCQVRYNARALFLANDGGHVGGVLYRDDGGVLHTARADAFLLAASPIESARLCLVSQHQRNGAALGNSSDQVGRNLMFHLQTLVNGFMPQRVHGQRGRAVTHGLSDTRGVEPGGEAVRLFDDGGTPRVRLGGIVEFSCPQGLAITEDGYVMAFDLQQTGSALRYGLGLKNALRDGALTQHLIGTVMQAEDAPQKRNRVDLDPSVKDVFGYPVARVTYKPHAFELQARLFYEPILKQLLGNAGAARVFLAPCNTLLRDPPDSHHVMGTLRMGVDPSTSVTNADGRFHDVDNLYACDGSVFPTASGYNPTLTIIATSLKIAHGLAGAPQALRAT
jgi:gluconate 2-dehydrogenase alpha chain